MTTGSEKCIHLLQWRLFSEIRVRRGLVVVRDEPDIVALDKNPAKERFAPFKYDMSFEPILPTVS